MDFVSLELALILFEIILTHACVDMIKALFVISYIRQIAYLQGRTQDFKLGEGAAEISKFFFFFKYASI